MWDLLYYYVMKALIKVILFYLWRSMISLRLLYLWNLTWVNSFLFIDSLFIWMSHFAYQFKYYKLILYNLLVFDNHLVFDNPVIFSLFCVAVLLFLRSIVLSLTSHWKCMPRTIRSVSTSGARNDLHLSLSGIYFCSLFKLLSQPPEILQLKTRYSLPDHFC